MPDTVPDAPAGITSSDQPAASTAAEQDHNDVDRFRGEDADPPGDTGKPAPDDQQDEDQAAERM